MFELKRILLPVDFSDGSLIAASQAGMLARHFHAETTLLHVAEGQGFRPVTGEPGGTPSPAERARAEYMTALRNQLKQFAATELPDTPVKPILCSGDPAKVIVNRAMEEQSDLILMPTHGGGAYRRFLLGSVTAKVLHDSEAPVWTGAHLERAPSVSAVEIRKVMCAVNFGPQTSATLRWAAGFAAAFDARLILVYAVLGTPPNLPDRYAFHWRSEAQCGADERLHALLLDHALAGEPCLVSDGNIPAALAKAVEDKAADVLVIGRNTAGQQEGKLGAHAYGIISRVSCPVVSV